MPEFEPADQNGSNETENEVAVTDIEDQVRSFLTELEGSSATQEPDIQSQADMTIAATEQEEVLEKRALELVTALSEKLSAIVEQRRACTSAYEAILKTFSDGDTEHRPDLDLVWTAVKSYKTAEKKEIIEVIKQLSDGIFASNHLSTEFKNAINASIQAHSQMILDQ